MITGNIKSNLKEIIEEKLSHLDLYSYYMPWEFTLNKNCCNPFQEDKNPSFRIYYRDGGYFHKSYNSSHKGDVWQFLMDYFGKSFNEIIEKIAEDFGLKEKTGKKFDKIVNNLPKIEKKESKPPIIKATVYKEFKERHIEYLKQYYLTPEDMNFCSDTKVLPLKSFYMNGTKFPVRSDEVGFVYLVNNQYIKVYLPNRPKGEKFWSNIPFTHIHGLDNLKGCKKAVLTKSMKDAALIHKYILPCVAVIQAENISCISEENREIIKNSVENLYINMDVDPTGKKASYALCDLLQAKHVNIPDKYFPQSTDFADMAKNEGIDKVIEHFKIKKII